MTSPSTVAVPADGTEGDAGEHRRSRPAQAKPMVTLVKRRMAQLVMVLLGVSFLTFVLLNLLPGDPALAVLGEDATPSAIEAFTREHGLNDPVILRYFEWLGGVLRGDFGTSYINDRDVLDTIQRRAVVSAELVVLSQLIALAAAVPAALIAVRHRDTVVDRAISATAFVGLSVPSFLLGFVLILVFAVHLGWLPASGFARLSDGLWANLRTAIMPAVSLAVAQYAVYMRLLRSEMLETIDLDYVTTARGKGIRTTRVMTRHVMRNSLLPLITVAGVGIGTLLGGAVITESIFAIPGVGRLLIDSIYARDLMMVQGVVLYISVAYVVINLVVDLLYSYLDPRIRHGSVNV